VLVLISLVHVHLASFANDYGIFSFQNYTSSNFQMFLHLFKWETWKAFELMHFLLHFFLNWFSSRVKNLNVRLDFFLNYANAKILIIIFMFTCIFFFTFNSFDNVHGILCIFLFEGLDLLPSRPRPKCLMVLSYHVFVANLDSIDFNMINMTILLHFIITTLKNHIFKYTLVFFLKCI
jgi:hypothetical protein